MTRTRSPAPRVAVAALVGVSCAPVLGPGGAPGDDSPEGRFFRDVQAGVRARCGLAVADAVIEARSLTPPRNTLGTHCPRRGRCSTYDTLPSAPEAYGASFDPAAAPACEARLLSLADLCVVDPRPGADVLAVCDGLYAGGAYHASPPGAACTRRDECAATADGPGLCASWSTPGPAGAVHWSRCTVGVRQPAAGDACGDVAGYEGYDGPVELQGDPSTLRVAYVCPLHGGPSVRAGQCTSDCGPASYCARDGVCRARPGPGGECDEAPRGRAHP